MNFATWLNDLGRIVVHYTYAWGNDNVVTVETYHDLKEAALAISDAKARWGRGTKSIVAYDNSGKPLGNYKLSICLEKL